MKVSKKWLQKYFTASLPEAEALAHALTFHAFEIEEVVRTGDDEVLDVKVTPNRGHDCLCHRGIAKELSAILEMPLGSDPLADKPNLSDKTDAVSVSIENPQLCPRYIAGFIRGVKVGPSPKWLQERLEAIGQRSINNVVDATNFVMFNLGQPLHAFDAGKLKNQSGCYAIRVRSAKPNEKLIALDKKEYQLSESMLVIVDDLADEAIGIAGVKGGQPAAITEATKDIIIESANFDGPSVRKTAAALKLRTDASSRFEQVISPNLAAYGMEAVVKLITELAQGEAVGFTDVYPEPQKAMQVSVSTLQVKNVLGDSFGANEIEDAFSRLGFSCEKKGETYVVEVPFERLDLRIAEDLIEETGRIEGYDRIPPEALPPFPKTPELNANFYAAEQKREQLRAEGYSEVYTSVFVDKGERVVLNKVDGVRPYLRSSLLPGLQEALKKNVPNKDLLGLKEIKLFEISTVWEGGKETMMIGTITEKGKAEEKPLEARQADGYEVLPLSKVQRYQPFSRFPYIVRDVAAWVPIETEEDDVCALIRQEAGELALKISLFDRFEKAGRVSLAFRIIFQSFERTLEDAEVNDIMERVYTALRAKGFEIR